MTHRFRCRLALPWAGLLLLAIGGCGVPPVDEPDLGVVADLAVGIRPDLARVLDLAVADLTMVDQAIPPDVAMDPPDLTEEPLEDLSRPKYDFAVGPDLRVIQDFVVLPDLTPEPDLYGADLRRQPDPYRYVVNSILLPTQPTDYSVDLNGDGMRDNALAGLIVELRNLGVDAQANVEKAVLAGSDIKLLRFDTIDPMFVMDNDVFGFLRQGIGKPMPDYSGLGRFTPDNNQSTAVFPGLLVNHAYTSASPTAGKLPVDYNLRLFLFSPNFSILLPLHGTHIGFTTGIDVKSGAPGLLDGNFQGSMKEVDLVKILVPAIAASLEQVVINHGMGEIIILNQIDTGNCVNGQGQMAKAGDKVIDDCELLRSAMFAPVLALDVQIYDGIGAYKPNPQNLMKDSWSVGIGFTGVQAFW